LNNFEELEYDIGDYIISADGQIENTIYEVKVKRNLDLEKSAKNSL